MSEIDQEAVQDLFNQLLSGAVLDGLTYEQCENPWEHCRSIMRSWHEQCSSPP